MTLSDRDIRHALEHGQLSITPFADEQLQPASYDVRLGQGFLVPANMAYGECVSIDRAVERFPRYFHSQGAALGAHVLNPGQFAWAARTRSSRSITGSWRA